MFLQEKCFLTLFRFLLNLIDFVSLMCAMTDLVQRIEKHSSSDMQKLSKIKAREESVTSKTATRLQKRSESIKFLKGEDEEKLVSTTSEGLQQHVQSLSLDLAQAEQEEEEARKVTSLNYYHKDIVIMLIYVLGI